MKRKIEQLRVEKIVAMYKGIKNVVNIPALYSDETENYRFPREPKIGDDVTVMMRAGRGNVNRVFLCTKTERIPMVKQKTEGLFDYFQGILSGIEDKISYYFELETEDITYWYTKKGAFNSHQQDGWFFVLPNFDTPKWARGAVMYQIFVDRFCRGSEKNDVRTNEYIYLGKPVVAVEDWNKLPDGEDIRNFYGGDLVGVMDKLEYLKDLGVEAVYFNPLFVSPSNHKYDTQDYDYIDPHLTVIAEDGGETLRFEKFNNKHAELYKKRTTDRKNLEASNAFFIAFVEKAHSLGLKVILDGVFNHCGAFHKWLDREGFYSDVEGYPPGAFQDKDSPYKEYFTWFEGGNYDGWWGLPNHPKLNFENSPDLYVAVMNIAKKWVSPPFCADGWRLDVAADLGHSPEFNHAFWKDFRHAVKEANPEAIIIAEHYGDPSSWLMGDEWDTVMNYDAFMEPVSWFLTGLEKHSDAYRGDLFNNAAFFASSMRHNMAGFAIQSLEVAMNQLSNHDHSRFLTRTNKHVGRISTVGAKAAEEGINPGIMKEAVLLQMTWPGAPTLYYGDEAGLCGWTDPDNRRTYPWGRENRDILEFHRAAIAIRKKHQALKTGSLLFLTLERGVLGYGRFDKENKMLMLFNNTETERTVTVSVWQIEVGFQSTMTSLLTSWREGFSTEEKEYPVENGSVEITLLPFSGMVLKEKDNGN